VSAVYARAVKRQYGMQRVVSIHLNGGVYQLEENGYNALFAYLDAVDAQLKDDPDRAQKLADLEARVAELCKACLAPHKAFVTSMEIDRVIAQLWAGPGPLPGQTASDAGPAAGATSQTTAGTTGSGSGAGTRSGSWSAGPFLHRRLYQIREGSMISGVCMGLAEYVHVDVTFIRIMFVLFALVTSGWGILAYAVLMFVVPRVNTRADASAHDAGGTMPPHRWPWDDGWPWDKYGWPWDKHGWPWDKHGWPWDTHGWPWDQPRSGQPQPRAAQPSASTPPAGDAPPPPPAPPNPPQAARDARQQAREARREWRAERRAERRAYHPVSHFWGTFFMILCVVFAFFWLSLWTRGHFFFGWPYFWGFPHWVGIIVLFMVMRLVFIPWPRWHGYGYGPYAYPHYGWIAMWNGLAWFAVMIFGIWAAYHFLPEFRDFIRSFQAGYDYRYRL
jgi:phage shock protein PspC (stress-responsive transcriptional regulator)